MRIGLGVLLSAAALAGLFVFVLVRRPNPGRLAALAVSGPGAHAGHAHGTAGTASASGLQPVRRAAASSPGETGVYTVTWPATRGSKSARTATAASLDLYVLPDVTSAEATRRAAAGVRLAQSSMTAKGLGFSGRLHLSGVPGIEAASYISGTSPTLSASVPHVDVAVFRVGRVVAVGQAGGSTAGAAAAAVSKLVGAEHRHLAATGGRPALGETTVPPLATAVYLVVAAALVASVEASPAVVATVRRRRHAARAEAIRRERASRGRKVVKRRGSPALAGRSRQRR